MKDLKSADPKSIALYSKTQFPFYTKEIADNEQLFHKNITVNYIHSKLSQLPLTNQKCK